MLPRNFDWVVNWRPQRAATRDNYHEVYLCKATRNLIEWLACGDEAQRNDPRRIRLKKFVYTSSTSVYGQERTVRRSKESSPTETIRRNFQDFLSRPKKSFAGGSGGTTVPRRDSARRRWKSTGRERGHWFKQIFEGRRAHRRRRAHAA